MSAQMTRNFGGRDAASPVNAAQTGDRPIDLVYLSRQTLGDRELEIELLGLFERQAGLIVRQITNVGGAGDRRLRHDLAHTLKGSARAVGAAAVAATAQAFEDALYAGAAENEVSAALAALQTAVNDARAAVVALLGDK